MIYFVGAGSGAPDLITVRGAKLLGEADVIVYAGSLVNPALLDYAKGDCAIYDSAKMTLEEVIAVMAPAARAGKTVVRLHTGDPCVYGAHREQMDALDRLGLAYEVCPGVSSFCGAAAALCAEYTLPNVSQTVIITRMEGRTPVPETEQLAKLPNVQVLYSHKPDKIEKVGSVWRVTAGDTTVEAPFILNATYAGVNDIHAMLGLPPFKIKYEKCEIILCTVDERLKNTGITVMDGPFFSLMPFGQTGLHSLTSVTFTPHETSYDAVATFPCQQQSEGKCRPGSLYNCNECPAKPQSAWPYMSQLARKYLKEEYGFAYQGSLFSMKPILKASEIDDSRPTVVRVMNTEPMLVSVLSGKINTVYDLDEVLNV